MRMVLPTLIAGLWLVGCDSAEAPPQPKEKSSNVYLEALQEAEAAADSVEQRNHQEQRIDALLGREAADRPGDN
jgi:hypothetical protein